MRKKLAAEPFEEIIRKVGQLIALVCAFPKAPESKVAKRNRMTPEKNNPSPPITSP
jgi:hypothetical protein